MSQGDLFAAAPAAPTGPHPPSLPDNALREPLANCFDRVPADWRVVTEPFRRSPTGQGLIDFVDARRAAGAVIYPAEVFRALQLTPLAQIKVVILGQDPYHGPGQAQGLAFSVPSGQKLPPSLRHIFQEARCAGGAAAADGDLTRWARQGVLLLNTVLTVEDGCPHSHAGRGWEPLTDALIAHVSAHAGPCVFLLWGGPAQKKRGLVDEARHLVLAANHPSPLSARRPPQPFLGCGHFAQANEWLAQHRPADGPVHW